MQRPQGASGADRQRHVVGPRAPALAGTYKRWRPQVQGVLADLDKANLDEGPTTRKVDIQGILVVARVAKWINFPVYRIEVGPPKAPFLQCAAKRQIAALKAYEQLRNPKQARFLAALPRVVETEGAWFVMEQIVGEGGEVLTARVGSEEAYARSWGALSGGLLATSAIAGLELPDVGFAIGHNCMREPGLGRVRLVEVDSFAQSERPAGELAGSVLLDELDHCAGSLGRNFVRRREYAFELMRAVLQRIPAKQILARGTREKLWLSPGRPHVTTIPSRIPSQLLCQTASRGHFDAFKGVLQRREHAVQLLDPADRRSWLRDLGRGAV